jgi:hypothetical protein
MNKNEGFKVKYYNMDLVCKGIILFWSREIHIAKKYKNTPLANLILRHELTHYKFFKIIKKYYKLFKIEKRKTDRNWQKMLKLTIFIQYWIFYNNLWDIWDCEKLSLSELGYDLGWWGSKPNRQI